MSQTIGGAGQDNLLDLATAVAGWARDGEQVEAYVARGRDTEITVFGGEVESLSSAESAGIGIRVVVEMIPVPDRRQIEREPT